ncbi:MULTISPECIES: hypothetical protein [unclassified Streptomyces]|uniref:hypothetical protein n=1 Tax=unclassified Streptomyces TaxID=2593676 RepID=UPI0035D64CF6
MTDVVRVALLGVIALGVTALCLMYKSFREQIDALRAEVACLRIEQVLGEVAPSQGESTTPPRLGLGLVVGAVIGAATTSGATWVLWG